jgi:hypothetical protein
VVGPRNRFSERSLTYVLISMATARALRKEGEGRRRRDRPSPGEHRASPAGNGRRSNGPDDGGRPRGPASAPCRGRPRRSEWETTCSTTWGQGRGGKGSGEGTASDGRAVTFPPSGRGVSRGRRCRRREGFGGQERVVGKSRFVAGRKHGEPQDRQQGETDLHGRGGASRRGGGKPRGRNAEREASRSRRVARRLASPASDSSARDDGGAIFGQPQERKSGREAGPHGSGRDGRAGVKVRRVASPCVSHGCAPRS